MFETFSIKALMLVVTMAFRLILARFVFVDVKRPCSVEKDSRADVKSLGIDLWNATAFQHCEEALKKLSSDNLINFYFSNVFLAHVFKNQATTHESGHTSPSQSK